MPPGSHGNNQEPLRLRRNQSVQIFAEYNIKQCHLMLAFDSSNLPKTGDRFSTQLAKMSIDPEVVELTADVVTIFSVNRTDLQVQGAHDNKQEEKHVAPLYLVYHGSSDVQVQLQRVSIIPFGTTR